MLWPPHLHPLQRRRQWRPLALRPRLVRLHHPWQHRADALATSLYTAAQAHLPGHRLRTDYTDAAPDLDLDLEKDFHLLRHTTAPAVLTENFFMDSHNDCDFLLSEEGQEAIVNLHFSGITYYISGL